ncbi:hypothetical protein ColTof4_07669 [Colletotrichum tofieldiae]|nr:hypothetical protein ColTof3_02804 [Colletotrichum tofieldiae]GKT75246.1 hypothetical protein ColTof4_07669 [Colletotrichum tofieldiae]GKT82896.1 hypothetical protein Ct61P_00746 [Colletotrichum tofieldiae]
MRTCAVTGTPEERANTRQETVTTLCTIGASAAVATFHWRVTPELYAFGLNYESVGIYSGMAGYL